ncbi:hypothetical protein Zm00014a_034054 [Zea mays]|uniref:Uncharacterized protein n=1 Tax=Zea mays TaxID=4577 RepID=A0A3L6DBG0_MAIZE|nr:hypothetical protein Zm00014a_034054 [Zea mays]
MAVMVSEVAGNEVKTDKGFKEIYLNTVVKNVCKLKDISGALWDEDNFVISLEEGHYASYIKDHQKDADYLNKPIENYMPMQIIFGSGVATCRFAMGSNEPFDKPTDIADILDDNIEVTSKFVDGCNLTGKGKTIDKGTPGFVSDVAAIVHQSIHVEAAPGIYNAAINYPGFSREDLMYAKNHMMEHKATSLVFLDMTPNDRDLLPKTFLAKHYHI